MTEEEPVQDVEMEAEEEDDSSIFALRLLPLTHDLHQKHGLRHNDYQRYRGYCSRRIARVRKAVKLVQGEKKKYHKKLVTVDNAKEAKTLLIPLMTAERAWGYAMQLKFEMNSEPRKKYHMLNRLRKAAKEAAGLEKLVMALEGKADARAKLEVQAYSSWMAGTLAFELQDWKGAAVALTKARTIYENVAETISEDDAVLYKQRMADIVPSLRFCAYNSGDDVAKQELLTSLRGSGLDELISQTREEQASTLQEVEWRGRKMAVKQEKVRLFLLREQEFAEEELAAVKDKDYDATIEAYESLLLDCKDAIQVLRDELVEDSTFRNRQTASEGPTTSTHFLYTYLSHIKCSKTIDRNLCMTDFMRRCLEGEKLETKKPVKPQDLVRLFETIIANLSEQPGLAGMEEDLEFKQSVEATIIYFKAWRCNYLAQAFLAAQKWPEAMALFQRATVYAKKAKNDKMLESKFRSQVDSLQSMIEGRQFMAHANSILDTEGVTESVAKVKLGDKKKLFDRLDEYYEDEDLVKGKPNLVDFPPNFTAIPCKPLFYDLAREQLAFPDLEDRMAAPAGQGGPGGQQGASGGWLGGWLGWGGKK